LNNDIITNCFCFELEEKAIEYLMANEKNQKLILKVYKKILKQVEKNPMQTWFEININDYSPKEMRLIKRYFCDWCGFGFSESIPHDKMFKQKMSISYTSSITGVIDNTSYTTTSTSYTTKSEKTPIEKFYITWFNEN